MTSSNLASSNDSAAGQGRSLAQFRHDLRTPINHIVGYGEMLLEDAADSAPALVEEVKSSLAAAARMLEVIDHFLSGSDAVSMDALVAVRQQLRLDVDRTENGIGGLLEQTDQPWLGEFRADLEKMLHAVRSLRSLSDSMVAGVRPDDQTEPREAEPDAAPTEPPPVDAPLVLVVDDYGDNRDLLSRRLQRDGLRTLWASGGAKALEILHGQSIDLVLLDVLMPEMDGYEVLRRMKEDPALSHVPVVMISALEELASVVRCIELGAEDYLPKPFNPVLLRARVNACLEKKKLRDHEQEQTRELQAALTQLEATKDQLVMQERLASLGALTAGIAHEIKNPLNFVNNFAQLTVGLVQELRELLDPSAAENLTTQAREEIAQLLAMIESNVERIQEHGKRADGIIHGMLLHSRGGKGDRQPTDLNGLLREFAGLALHGLKVKDPSFNVELIQELDPTVGKVDVVAQDLSRVFLNIANNACYAAHERKKSAPSGFSPTVRLRTQRSGDRVEIRIGDNGAGISQANLKKIFEPFFTTKPTGSGTGLGLSISRDIVVKGHQGDMRVESKEGEGAEFVIDLPAPR